MLIAKGEVPWVLLQNFLKFGVGVSSLKLYSKLERIEVAVELCAASLRVPASSERQAASTDTEQKYQYEQHPEDMC